MQNDLYMVFDVESVGLYGAGFAVAWVVVKRNGKIVLSASYYCPPDSLIGSEDDQKWVRENVTVPQCGKLRYTMDVRNEFWRAWVHAKSQGATLWAECCWPVEARFLLDVIYDDPENRKKDAPYPLHDIATIRLAAGFDPLATVDRLKDEIPAHNPLCDARQSARLMLEAMNLIDC